MVQNTLMEHGLSTLQKKKEKRIHEKVICFAKAHLII